MFKNPVTLNLWRYHTLENHDLVNTMSLIFCFVLLCMCVFSPAEEDEEHITKPNRIITLCSKFSCKLPKGKYIFKIARKVGITKHSTSLVNLKHFSTSYFCSFWTVICHTSNVRLDYCVSCFWAHLSEI